MSNEKKDGYFTLRIPRDRDQKKFFEIQLNDIDETTFIMVQKVLSAGKQSEAVRLMVKQLWVGGNCTFDEFSANFLAVHSASNVLIEMITPMEGTLKKN